jgi:methylglyoxal reductase
MSGGFERAEFPGTGRSVLRLGFGAMGFGGHFGVSDPKLGVEVVLEALRSGVDFLDTARAYGDSEKILGEALRQWDGPQPFLATKAQPIPARATAPKGAGWQHPSDLKDTFPRGTIRQSLLASLRDLRLERVDLLQLHQYWAHWETEEWHSELEGLRREGLVRYIGISVPDHRHDLAISLVQAGLVDSVQTIINIFDPLALDSLVPICASRGVAVIARCILDEGGLAGAIDAETRFAPGDWLHGYFDSMPRAIYLAHVNRLRRFVPSVAHSLAELAIRYVLSFPGVSVALCSMHIREHLVANLLALEAGPLPSEIVEELRHRDRWIRNFYQARRYVEAS